MERRSRPAGYLSGALPYEEARPAGRHPPASRRASEPGVASFLPPSATRFRPLPRASTVAHARSAGPIRENTDPPTTGNP
ncbi:hypothetical protein DF048_13810 [Burkholderia seminalis]|nr:hypothetical protein DF048_13810 [Burkholderia seminalis]